MAFPQTTPLHHASTSVTAAANMHHHFTQQHHQQLLMQQQQLLQRQHAAAVSPRQSGNSNWETGLRHFVAHRVIGRGSFGSVVLVQNTDNDSFYALKVMKKESIVARRQVQHVSDEKAILSQIRHRHIVQLEGVFQDCHNVYFLMEYVGGGELYSFMRKVGAFNRDQASFYAREILIALNYLHTQNIAYRDLKPENILIDGTGHVKLVDFGFAKYLPHNQSTYTMCGTPEYLAPEVLLSGGHDWAVDMWSFGVLLYEMMAGHSPFYRQENKSAESFSPENTNKAIYDRIIRRDFTFPDHFDEDLKDLINGLLAFSPAERLTARQAMDHPFFRTTNWSVLECGYADSQWASQLGHIPAFVPELRSEGDDEHFDHYEDDPSLRLPIRPYKRSPTPPTQLQKLANLPSSPMMAQDPAPATTTVAPMQAS